MGFPSTTASKYTLQRCLNEQLLYEYTYKDLYWYGDNSYRERVLLFFCVCSTATATLLPDSWTPSLHFLAAVTGPCNQVRHILDIV